MTVVESKSVINEETCESLRGDMDASDLKEYVIAMLFLKRVNDQFDAERQKRKADLENRGVNARELEEGLERENAYKFFVPKLARWERTLYATVEEYLAQYSRALRSNLENLWEKYRQPLHSILKDRDAASADLAGYLKELGYE